MAVESSTAVGPLSGVTVVSIEHAVAAPMASRQFADLGARVIKIERPDGGDFSRSYDHVVGGQLSSTFLWTSRGKESVAMDLKSQVGRDALGGLLAKADVFINNLAPGAMSRLGFGTDQLRTRYPELVIVTNSGYGDQGPYAGRRAYDAIVQCESGLVAATGTPETMVKPGFSAADVAAGMYMFAAALTGLYQRSQTGSGSVTDIVMHDAITDWFANHIYYAQHAGGPSERVAVGHPSVVPYGIYRTAEHAQLVIAVQNDREWVRFAHSVLERPNLATDERMSTNPMRAKNRTMIDKLVAEGISQLTRDEAIRRLEAGDIAYGFVNSLQEAAQHPQFLARDRWIDTTTPAGTVPTLRPVIAPQGSQFVPGAVPALGQDTASVFEELGMAADGKGHAGAPRSRNGD